MALAHHGSELLQGGKPSASRSLTKTRPAGVVDCKAGTGSVELKRYPKSHAFAQLSGSDNIISFTTQRYSSQPLIVRYCSAAS